MTVGVWILGDQLWEEQAALQSCSDIKKLPVIFIESLNHVKIRPYHKQKLVLVWSAMRHFAEELKSKQYSVTYEMTDDFQKPLQNWVKEKGITELRVMMPNDRLFTDAIKDVGCPINFIPNNHFLWNRQDFINWAGKRKRLLMEDFYREGRRRFNILMEGKQPVGGQWNFDKENRQPPKGKLKTPEAKWFEPDKITQEVIAYVNSLTIPTFGELTKFHWGVTRGDALEVLDWFIQNRLPDFGPYQDAMVTGEETMWHSMISAYINIGLLHPLEVIQAAEKEYHQKELSLNSVEGFIRQVLGWREYMHGIYHYVSVDYREKNWLTTLILYPSFSGLVKQK